MGEATTPRQMSRSGDKCRARDRSPGGWRPRGRALRWRHGPPHPLTRSPRRARRRCPASAASVDHFTVSVSPRPVHAGERLTVRAVARDRAGATLSDYAGPAHFTDSAGSVDAAFTRGAATAEIDTDKPVHGEVVEVSDEVTTSSSAPFNVLGPVTSLTLSVPAKSDAGSPFTAVVVARDAAGSLVSDYAGVPAWSDSAGMVAGTQPAAFAKGVSRTTLASTAPVAGDVLTVNTADASAASRPFSRVGAVDHIDLSVPSRVNAGQSFSVVARARDSVGNLVAGFNGPAQWNNRNRTLTPTTPQDFVSGVSTTSAVIAADAQADAITLTAAGVTVTSRSFDVVGSFTTLSITGVPAAAKAGTAFTLVVSARDYAGNVLT